MVRGGFVLYREDYVVLFDDGRQAVGWIVDDDYPSLYLADGTPVAWLLEGALYAFGGRYLGYLEDGWVWDRHGYAVMFTSESEEAADMQSHRSPPPKSARKPRPPIGVREVPPARPMRRGYWATVCGEAFLRQMDR